MRTQISVTTISSHMVILTLKHPKVDWPVRTVTNCVITKTDGGAWSSLEEFDWSTRESTDPVNLFRL